MPKSQKQRILEALESHPQGLSHLELDELVHIPATSKRIADLRNDGFVIDCEDIEGKSYGRYVLVSYPELKRSNEWPTEKNTSENTIKTKRTKLVSDDPAEKQASDITTDINTSNPIKPPAESVLGAGMPKPPKSGVKESGKKTENVGDLRMDFMTATRKPVERVLYRCPKSGNEEWLEVDANPVCGCHLCGYHSKMIRVPEKKVS